jgi:hypothetical protein
MADAAPLLLLQRRRVWRSRRRSSRPASSSRRRGSRGEETGGKAADPRCPRRRRISGTARMASWKQGRRMASWRRGGAGPPAAGRAHGCGQRARAPSCSPGQQLLFLAGGRRSVELGRWSRRSCGSSASLWSCGGWDDACGSVGLWGWRPSATPLIWRRPEQRENESPAPGHHCGAKNTIAGTDGLSPILASIACRV